MNTEDSLPVAVIHTGDIAYHLNDGRGMVRTRLDSCFVRLPLNIHLLSLASTGWRSLLPDDGTDHGSRALHDLRGQPRTRRQGPVPSLHQPLVPRLASPHNPLFHSICAHSPLRCAAFSRMPGAAKENGNMWYSWDVGLVHFIAITTDHIDNRKADIVSAQREWLIQDLEQAQANRYPTPPRVPQRRVVTGVKSTNVRLITGPRDRGSSCTPITRCTAPTRESTARWTPRWCRQHWRAYS